MGGGERLSDGVAIPERVLAAHAFPFQPRPQRLTLEVLQGQVGKIPVPPNREDIDDVWVAQPGGRLRLEHEALDAGRRKLAGEDELQRDLAAELHVTR